MRRDGLRAALTGGLSLLLLIGTGTAAGWLGTWVPFGIALVAGTALGISAIFDAGVHVATQRSRSSLAWLVLTSVLGGAAALAGLGYTAVVLFQTLF